MAGGQLDPVTLVGGSTSTGGQLQNATLTAIGHNTSGLQLANDTLFAQGTTGNTGRVGALAIALAAAGFSGQTQVSISVALAKTLDSLGLSAHDSPSDVYLTATGTVRNVGTGGVLAPMQFGATGTVGAASGLASTLGNASLVAAGAVAPGIVGSLAVTLDTVALYTVPVRQGALNVTLDYLTGQANGSGGGAVVQPPIATQVPSGAGGGAKGGKAGGKAHSTPPAPQQSGPRYAQVTKSKTVFGIRTRHAQKLPQWNASKALNERRALAKLAALKTQVEQHNMAVLAQVLSEL